MSAYPVFCGVIFFFDFSNALIFFLSQYAMKLSLLYREYQEHLKNRPQEMSEMRAKLKNLEDEVLRLRSVEAQCEEKDRQISALTQQAQDSSILQGRQAQRVLDLEAQLRATEIVVTSLEATQVALGEEARLAKVEKEEVVNKLKMATERFEEAEGRCEYLKRKLSYFKVKAARYFKQLSFLPWLRDHGWARGFNWGFEAFRTLVLHPNLFDFDAGSVKSDFLPVPEAARNELHYMGEELFPDCPNWKERMGFPTDPSLPQLPSDVSDSESYDTADDDSRDGGS
jgi:hypothetical protein